MLGPQDIKVKKYADDTMTNPVERAVSDVVSLALMILMYNGGKEQRELAVIAVRHFAKIAVNNEVAGMFANQQLIDQIVQMHSFVHYRNRIAKSESKEVVNNCLEILNTAAQSSIPVLIP
eukprot:TRINITY_DN13478_c0_g2_i1.p2 TRINITY_DN13478_c0_g2~~TRINITY_DN13478_c0_g2_i1.p2  ORF type:complete len:120 (+),score=9.53 TRINITY_DN13478_c0_g2_i1:352-711(+)